MHWVWRSVSTWILAALAALLLLQLFTYPGLFLTRIGGPYLAGMLVHVFLASVFIEAVERRLPRPFVILPIVLYGAYYVAYLAQGYWVAEKAAELRATNPRLLIAYNSEQHSLVMPEARPFTEGHKIEVVYEALAHIKPEGHLAHRLFLLEDCNTVARGGRSRVEKVEPYLARTFRNNVCVIKMPERPPKRMIEISVGPSVQEWKRKWGISEQAIQVKLEGKVLGAFRTAHYWRLPEFPQLQIGCAFMFRGARRQCGWDIVRTSQWISGIPADVDKARYDSPVSIMLGIEQFTAADVRTFRGYPSNAEALQRAQDEPGRARGELFDQLQAMLSGKVVQPPRDMGYWLAREPERLAPLAKPMADLFVELLDGGVRSQPHRTEILQALGVAIPALPREAFGEVAEAIFAVAGDKDFWQRYPALYLRASDIGPYGLPLYREHFMLGKFGGYLQLLPVLAICRIGRCRP